MLWRCVEPLRKAMEEPKQLWFRAKNVCKRFSWFLWLARTGTRDGWKRILWLEETKINRFHSDGYTWVWIRLEESLKSQPVKMTVQQGKSSIRMWRTAETKWSFWLGWLRNSMTDTGQNKLTMENKQWHSPHVSWDRLFTYGFNKRVVLMIPGVSARTLQSVDISSSETG